MFVDNNIDDFNVLRRKYVYNSTLEIYQNKSIANIQIIEIVMIVMELDQTVYFSRLLFVFYICFTQCHY